MEKQDVEFTEEEASFEKNSADKNRIEEDKELEEALKEEKEDPTEEDERANQPQETLFKSKGMKNLASRWSEGNKREFSPEEFEILDGKGKEIVEILKDEGTIQKYPPVEHSPIAIQPRKVIYSQNFMQESNEEEGFQRKIKSPEEELVNESAYIPIQRSISPLKDKENVTLNVQSQFKGQNQPIRKNRYEMYENSQNLDWNIPDPISFEKFHSFPPQQNLKSSFIESQPPNFGYLPQPQQYFGQSIQYPTQPQQPSNPLQFQPQQFNNSAQFIPPQGFVPPGYYQNQSQFFPNPNCCYPSKI